MGVCTKRTNVYFDKLSMASDGEGTSFLAKKCYLENQLQMSVNIIKIYIGTGFARSKEGKAKE